MHILHINELYGQMGGGGTEQYLPNLCALLRAAGHQASVIYGTGSAGDQQPQDADVHHVPRIGYWSSAPNWRRIAEAMALVSTLRPDLVVIHQIADDFLVEELHHRLPVVAFVHNHVFTCPAGSRLKKEPYAVCADHGGLACLPKMLLRRCASRRPTELYDGIQRLWHTRRMLSFADRIMVDSTSVAQSLAAHAIDRARITVSPSITEAPPAAPPTPVPADPEILYVGTLAENKGPQQLIAALAGLRRPWRLTLVGEGFLRGALEAQVAQLGLAERVRFAGWVHKSAIGCYYEAARLVVVPSLWPEPLGLVGAEAMAHGRPVVAYNVGGIGEWLTDHQSGLLATWGSPSDLARQIARLLDDDALAARLGAGGRTDMETRLHPQRHLEQALAVYHQAANDWQSRGLRRGERHEGGAEMSAQA